MKKYISISIMLILFSSFKPSLAMEEDLEDRVEEAYDLGSDVFDTEEKDDQISQKVLSLQYLSNYCFVTNLINLYDTDGFDYKDCLHVFYPDNISEIFVQEFSSLMIQKFKREDILVRAMLDFYKNLNIKKREDRVKGMKFLNNFTREIKNLLCECFCKTIEDGVKKGCIKASDPFVWNLVRSADLKWLNQLKGSLSSRQTALRDGSVPFTNLGEIIFDIELRLHCDAMNTLREEKEKCQKSEKENSEAVFVQKLIAWLLNRDSELPNTLQEEAKYFSNEKRNKIIDVIWVNYINIRQSPLNNGGSCFANLFMLLYPDNETRIEQESNLLEKIILHYPKSIKIFYITANACLGLKFINYLFQGVHSNVENKIWQLLISDDESVREEINNEIFEAERRFGFRFMIDLCRELLSKHNSLDSNEQEKIKQNFFSNFKHLANDIKEKSDFPMYKKLGYIILENLQKMETHELIDSFDILWGIMGSFATLE